MTRPYAEETARTGTESPADLKPYRLAVRLPAWLLAEIDREVERLRALRPGGSLNRSDVVREILAHVLSEPKNSA